MAGGKSRPQRYSNNDERDEGLASLRCRAGVRKWKDDVCGATHEQGSTHKTGGAGDRLHLLIDQPRRSRRQEGYPETAAISDCKISTRGCAATTKQKLTALDGKDRLWGARGDLVKARAAAGLPGPAQEPARRRGECVCDLPSDVCGVECQPISARWEPLCECRRMDVGSICCIEKGVFVTLSPRSPFPLASPSLAALPSCRQFWLAVRPC